MKRYDLECGYGGGDRLVASVDGEWIRYENHVEAMKRIAGAPVAQGLTAPQMAMLHALLVAIRPEYGTPGSRDVEVGRQQKRIDAALAILAQSAPRADHSGEGTEMVARKCTRCEYVGHCDCEVSAAPSASAGQAEPVAQTGPADIEVVIDEDNLPTWCAAVPNACHDHIKDAIDRGISEARHWVVRSFVRHPGYTDSSQSAWQDGYKVGIEKGRKDPAMHEAKYLEGYRAAKSAPAPASPDGAQQEPDALICQTCNGQGEVNHSDEYGFTRDECPTCHGSCLRKDAIPEQPPIDNRYVADGCEQFASPAALTGDAAPAPSASPAALTDVDAVMTKIQEFASTWAVVGGRFDDGTAMECAEECKAEIRAILAQAAADQTGGNHGA